MKKSTFLTVINFLIESEYDAQSLYHEVSLEPKLIKSAPILIEIARNEILHAKELEKIRLEDPNIEFPTNLIEKYKITDQIAKVRYTDFNNSNEALHYCIKEEKKAIAIYKDIADNLFNLRIKQILISICNEEKRHKKILQQLVNNKKPNIHNS